MYVIKRGDWEFLRFYLFTIFQSPGLKITLQRIFSNAFNSYAHFTQIKYPQTDLGILEMIQQIKACVLTLSTQHIHVCVCV